MSEYRCFDNVVSEAQIPKDGITSRTLYGDDHTKVVLFGFDAGQELSEHTASMPAILHILQGEGTLTLGGDSRPAAAGTWAYMPANLPHSVTASTPMVMILTMLKCARPSPQDRTVDDFLTRTATM